MNLTVPAKAIRMLGQSSPTTDAQVTFTWTLTDPFAVHIEVDMPFAVCHMFIDIGFFDFVIAQKVGRLGGLADNQPLLIGYTDGLFKLKATLADGSFLYVSVLGGHAHAIAGFAHLVKAEIGQNKELISGAIDEELAEMFGGEDEPAPGT